jgi:hypothetical protein
MKRKKYKVGDRVFYEDYKGDVASAIILRIEEREMDSDRYGRPAKNGGKVKYRLYMTGRCTAIEDYNCLPENDPRVRKYKDGRTFIASNFREQLVGWLTSHGAHKGDQDVSEILYDLSLEFE